MTKDEFIRLENIINSTAKVTFLANQDIEDTFFNFCINYTYDVCRKAVIDLIENEAVDSEGRRVPLSLYNVERKIEREARIRKDLEKQQQQTDRVCPNCGNKGYIITAYPAGAEYFRACSCSIGREKYPWFFMNWAQLQETGDEGSRRSWGSYEHFRAPEEYHRQAKYGK